MSDTRRDFPAGEERNQNVTNDNVERVRRRLARNDMRAPCSERECIESSQGGISSVADIQLREDKLPAIQFALTTK
jgi:hypothetical protein